MIRTERSHTIQMAKRLYIPKQAGTVTFTATIEDTNPQTGETKTVSGDSTVTFVYKNNVKP